MFDCSGNGFLPWSGAFLIPAMLDRPPTMTPVGMDAREFLTISRALSAVMGSPLASVTTFSWAATMKANVAADLAASATGALGLRARVCRKRSPAHLAIFCSPPLTTLMALWYGAMPARAYRAPPYLEDTAASSSDSPNSPALALMSAEPCPYMEMAMAAWPPGTTPAAM